MARLSFGSTILLTDSAQAAAATYAYDSWGNATSSGAQAAANPWTYAGGYNDMATSNRIKFGARYYNPFHGRFTQVDPSGQEVNRYLYSAAGPINISDPSGLLSGCATAWAKGGPDTCSEGGLAPIGPKEAACYQEAGWGILGGLFGGWIGIGWGAVVACARAITTTP